jgi:hypothetical protein
MSVDGPHAKSENVRFRAAVGMRADIGSPPRIELPASAAVTGTILAGLIVMLGRRGVLRHVPETRGKPISTIRLREYP